MNDTPEDLIGLAEAAAMAERSTATIRRWVRLKTLTRYEGPPARHGGSSVVLVSRAELLSYLVEAGQQPRQSQPQPQPSVHPEQLVQGSTDERSADVIIVELRARIAAEQAKTELATLMLKLEHAEQELHTERLATSRLQTALANASTELAVVRDKLDASEARGRALGEALRQADVRAAVAEQRAAFESGRTWWRRLVGGPVAGLPGEE